MSKKNIRVVAAVIKRDELYLITQRRKEAVLGGLWEFPGGKVEPGESDGAALARELFERLDCHIAIAEKLAERTTDYNDYQVTLALYAATVDEQQAITAKRVQDLRWIDSAEFERYPFPAADKRTMDALLGLGAKKG